jgi:hypothetical protein
VKRGSHHGALHEPIVVSARLISPSYPMGKVWIRCGCARKRNFGREVALGGTLQNVTVLPRPHRRDISSAGGTGRRYQ